MKTHRTDRRGEHFRQELRITHVALAFAIACCALLAPDLIGPLVSSVRQGTLGMTAVHCVFIAIISFLLYGNFVYLFARIGQLRRRALHRAPARDRLEGFYEREDVPTLAVLVPSYKEDPHVIRKTLLSAALQDYPNRRVALLIDNPPGPADTTERQLLNETRDLVRSLHVELQAQSTRFRKALEGFRERARHGAVNSGWELRRLGCLYREAAAWFELQAQAFPVRNHEDRFFVEAILERPAANHRARAAELEALAGHGVAAITEARLHREFRRLASLFHAELSSFERKLYGNLSHAPNKAMNLNSYISLMGRELCEVRTDAGLCLQDAAPAAGTLRIADADFVLTLDADSLLLPDYAQRLIHWIQQPGHDRVAIVQTPYSAFPGAQRPIERIAGATTDIQYLIHQGFTQYRATFWVGANALLRKRALESIATVTHEGGHPITRYIQDRTVIEDTESTVDLIAQGWSLHNYPARLAYSATPPDFGSLLIQRRRWANGGLIILPKFLRHVFSFRRSRAAPTGQALMGGHYLTSLAGVNLGVMLLLTLPVENALHSLWLPLATVPYFVLYARDLKQIGYRASDTFRVYALNLLLAPVNLGGVFRSLQQALTGRRAPFIRTPKVAARTRTPLFYLLAIHGFLLYCAMKLLFDVGEALWLHAVFALVNGGILAYAIARYIGPAEVRDDLLAALRGDPADATREARHFPNAAPELDRLAG